MVKRISTITQLEHEIIDLRARLEEAEQILHAIHNGEIDALVISTEHGKRVFTLESAEQPFRLLVENMSEGALTMTRESTILYANQRFAQMLKKPLEKLIGFVLLDLIRPADREKLQTLLDKDCNHRRLTSLDLIDANGGWVPVQLSLINLQLDNVPGNICAVVTDLTEQKQHEKALQESEARYRSLVENANEAIVVIKDNVIIFTNPMAEQMLSCSAKKMTSLPFNEFVHPEDRHLIAKRTKKRLSGDRPVNPFNYRLMDYEGNIKHIQENSVKIEWEGSSAVLALLTDVTEFKKMEDEMFKKDKLDAIGILAGGIAHDFNNYLATLQANISLAKLYKGDKVKIGEKLANMEKATQRAGELSNQLFTFAQGGAPLREKISIGKLITNDIKFALSGSPIYPNITMDADLYMVDADAGQLSQVFNNIAINAVQAMPEGGTLEVRAKNVDLAAETGNFTIPLPKGPYVKVTVRDTGTGIPQKHLRKIFDPFFTTKDKGRGLGLATSYSIIKKHGGHIDVESELGKGTSFTVLLPAVEGADGLQPAGKDALPGEGKILLMDDEKDLLGVMGDSLSILGYDVALSRDGRQALELYTRAREQNQPFDLVILDLTIPGGMGGKQTIKELLKIDPEVKAIVISGYSHDPVMSRYSDFGFKGMLAKPFTIEELSKVINEVIK